MALGSIIRELGVRISLKYDKASAEAVKRDIDKLASSARSVAIGIGGVAASLLGFAKAASSNSRELTLFSEELGISTDRLQELEYASMITAHVGREELVGSLQGISQALYDARRGNVDALFSLNQLQLGMDVLGDETITADQVLVKMADHVKDMKNPLTKMAVLSSLGVSPKLIPMLNKGSAGMAEMSAEARKMGLVIGDAAVKQGFKFDQSMSRVWMQLKNVTYTIGSRLIPHLTPLINLWMKLILKNKEFIATGITSILKAMAGLLTAVFKAAVKLSGQMGPLIDKLGGMDRLGEILVGAFAVFYSVKVITGIGTMISLVSTLASTMGTLAPVLLPIIEVMAALAVAIGGVVAIVADLTSDDSNIKKKFKEMFQPITDAYEAQKTLGDMTEEQQAEEMNKPYMVNKPGAAAFSVEEFKKKRGLEIISPSAPAAAGGPGFGAAGTNNFEANINVTMAPGTTAGEAVDIVSKAVKKAHDDMNFHAYSQSVGQGAY